MATLQNKTVVVIGSSSGIGFSVALAALQSLAGIVIIASSNPKRVENAVEHLLSHKLPGEVRGEVLNAKDLTAVKDFAERLGAVDHVAWTSGEFGPGGTELQAQQDLMASALALRFWGPAVFAKSVKFNSGGSFTLTSGTLDLKPRPGMGVWASVCASMDGHTKSLAVELAPVRVNVVAPGGIDTELWDGLTAEVKAEIAKDIERGTLLKRFGQPDETAEAYIFLMKCGYITGQRITVDGGIVLA